MSIDVLEKIVTSDYQKYPEYKDSRIEWLGDIPEHWIVSPLKYLSSMKGRLGWQGLRTDEYIDEGPLLVSSAHFENDRVNWNICNHVSTERYSIAPEIQLRSKDLLMMKDGASMGKLAYIETLPGPACLNSHLLLFRPKDGDFINKFLYYLFKTPVFEIYMIRERKGATFFGISQQSIGNFPFLLAPLSEQKSIVYFLDQKTAQIDTLIEKKQKQIELLKEYRSAVINQAVTRGLDPDVKMKDSGVEWLGEVPENWPITRIKFISQINPSKGSSEFEKESEEKVIFLPMEKVKVDGTYESDVLKEINEVWSGFTFFAKDDVIFAKITPCFENGKGAYLGSLKTKIGFGSTEFHVLRPLQSVSLGKYLYYLICSDYFKTNGEAFMTGAAGQKRVPTSFIENFHLGLPSVEEQKIITQHLDQKTSQIDTLIQKSQSQIKHLKEYRTTLISDAVTGKIDVRNFGEAN